MYKIEKTHLKNKEWAKIYAALNNDTDLVSKFIKVARKHKKIEAGDLDSVLEDINRHTKSHIEFSTSGINFI